MYNRYIYSLTDRSDQCQGIALLRDPQFNKGSTFSEDERQNFDLEGRLPIRISTLEEQLGRAYQQYSSRQGALAKNTFMTSMKEQNWVLYYKVFGCT